MKKKIRLTKAERKSKQNRVQWVEDLIKQLPIEHDGRNSWLMNFGTSKEAIALRRKYNLKWNKKYQACS